MFRGMTKFTWIIVETNSWDGTVSGGVQYILLP